VRGGISPSPNLTCRRAHAEIYNAGPPLPYLDVEVSYIEMDLSVSTLDLDKERNREKLYDGHMRRRIHSVWQHYRHGRIVSSDGNSSPFLDVTLLPHH
jgi:hypothetical protein